MNYIIFGNEAGERRKLGFYDGTIKIVKLKNELKKQIFRCK